MAKPASKDPPHVAASEIAYPISELPSRVALRQIVDGLIAALFPTHYGAFEREHRLLRRAYARRSAVIADGGGAARPVVPPGSGRHRHRHDRN